jgi:hypothetical protein
VERHPQFTAGSRQLERLLCTEDTGIRILIVSVSRGGIDGIAALGIEFAQLTLQHAYVVGTRSAVKLVVTRATPEDIVVTRATIEGICLGGTEENVIPLFAKNGVFTSRA